MLSTKYSKLKIWKYHKVQSCFEIVKYNLCASG